MLHISRRYSDGMVIRATCVCIRDGALLLMKQSFVDMPVFWSLPGGKVEENEPIHEALVREVEEETGLIVEVDRLLYVSQRILPTKHVVNILMQAKYVSGEVGENIKHTLSEKENVKEISFIDIHELEKYGLSPAFAERVRGGFPDAGSYIGSISSLGL